MNDIDWILELIKHCKNFPVSILLHGNLAKPVSSVIVDSIDADITEISCSPTCIDEDFFGEYTIDTNGAIKWVDGCIVSTIKKAINTKKSAVIEFDEFDLLDEVLMTKVFISLRDTISNDVKIIVLYKVKDITKLPVHIAFYFLLNLSF